MSRSLKIASGSSTFALPLDAITATFGILAVRGAGKSNAMTAMAEEMFSAGLPFVVVDPYGTSWGLRADKEGKPSGGLPIAIFGGRHGDLPLERTGGKLVADLVASKRLSCVLDLSEFESEAAKKQFLLDFARELFLKNRDPLHLFCEEADDYVPQDSMKDEKALVRAFENLVRRGRSRGIGITLVTQRSAVLNKKVLTQVETLFVLRTTGPQDIAAVREWVKYHQVGEEMLGSLAGLDDGEAWVWSPHFLKTNARFRFRRRQTFDSGATPKNVHGKDSRPTATLSDVDLGALRESMAATIERAKLEDPKELRKANALLSAELERLKKSVPVVDVTPKVIPAFDDVAFVELFEQITGEMAVVAKAQQDARAAVGKALNDYKTALKAGIALGEKRVLPARPLEKLPRVLQKSQSSNGELSGCPRALLKALLQRGGESTVAQMSVMAGYSSRSSTVRNAMSTLRTSSYVTGSGDSVKATDAGWGALPEVSPMPTGVELFNEWTKRLGDGAPGKFLDVLFTDPAGHSKRELAEKSGYSIDSSTFRNALSKLRVLGLIVEDGGQIFLTEEFMPAGRLGL